MIVALGLLATLALLVRRWSASGERWTDLHRLALAVGPLPASVAYGLTYVTSSSPMDQAGEAAATVLMALLLVLLGQRLRQRATDADVQHRTVPAGPLVSHHAG